MSGGAGGGGGGSSRPLGFEGEWGDAFRKIKVMVDRETGEPTVEWIG